jgi:prepilin peptidase CpaA
MEWHYFLLAIILLLAFYTDVTKMKIPNSLTLSATFLALLFHGIVSSWQGLLFSVLGLSVGFGLFLLLYLIGAIAAGDVKLFGAIGAWTGIDFVLYSSMYSVVYAGLIGVIILLLRKEFIVRISKLFNSFLRVLLYKDVKEIRNFKSKDALRFPFMYAVLPGVLTTYYYFIMG